MREVADDDCDAAEALLGQVGGEVDQRVLTGPREGLAQHQVLGRVAGQRHLGEDRQVRTGLGGLRRPPGDQAGVARQVAHRGVDLGAGDPQLRPHVLSLPAGAPR